MSLPGFLSSLNPMTLVVAFLIVAIGFAFFLRRRANRRPMEGRQERNIGQDLDAGREAPRHASSKE